MKDYIFYNYGLSFKYINYLFVYCLQKYSNIKKYIHPQNVFNLISDLDI